MHTNKTTYYELPQYIGSDIIDPLVDTNGAYSAIDTAIHNVASDVATNITDIDNLEAQNGSETLTTTAQTLSGAINELDDDLNNETTGAFALIGANSADIATINGVIGDANSGMIKDIGQLQTTVGAQGLSITSLETAVGDADSGLVKDVSDLQTSVGSLVTAVGDENSGIIKDVDDLQTAISGLELHNVGSPIDLSTYTTSSYVTLTDGYLYLYSPSGGTSHVGVMNQQGELAFEVRADETRNSLYIKKGMRLKSLALTGTDAFARFMPLQA